MNRITDLERQYVSEVLNGGFALSESGKFAARLEKEMAAMMNARFGIAHANGTCTMHSALAALSVEPGDEVIVPALTMSSPALAIIHNGSVPVFADVDPDTFNILPESVLQSVTPKTRAMISVALYGLPPDYDALTAICRDFGLRLIEDNALAFLSSYKGKLTGEFGDFASFSFQSCKQLTAGEGGMLLTSDPGLALAARRFSSLGFGGITADQARPTRKMIQDPTFERHVSPGFNYRLPELNAAVALAQVQRAKELVECRKSVASLYRLAIGDHMLVKPQAVMPGYENTYWSFAMVLRTDKPEKDWYAFRDLFVKNGGDGFYSAWKPAYQEPLFRDFVRNRQGVWQHFHKGLCPNAEYLQPRMIQLKTNYWNLPDAEKQAEILQKTLHEFHG